MRSQSSYATFLRLGFVLLPLLLFLLLFFLSPLHFPPPSFSIYRSSKDQHCFGIQTVDSWNGLCLATLLDTEVTNPMEYEFNFQLEIRGPCLLAGERVLPRPRETKKTKGDGASDPKPPEIWGGKRLQRPPNPDRSQN